MVTIQGGGDRRVQVHQMAMTGQARPAGAARLQTRRPQAIADRLHHQLVFQLLLFGGQQVGAGFWGGGAGQGIAAQLPLAHREQSFGRGADQGGTTTALPEEAAAAALVATQRSQQG